MTKKLKYSEIEAKNAVYEKIISEQAAVISEQAELIDFMAKKVEEL